MLVPALPYRDPGNYVHVSERTAKELAQREPNGALWANQWDNPANWRGHYETTGPEIWMQTGGKVDAFTCSIGTGGTGVATDDNAVPAEHFTFSTMILPAGCEGPLHLHTDAEEVFFILKGSKVRFMIEHQGQRFEIRIARTGYAFDLRQPLPVTVLPGRILGAARHAIETPIPNWPH